MAETRLAEALAQDIKRHKWKNIALRATAVSVDGNFGDPEHLPFVRDMGDALEDGMPVEYPPRSRAEEDLQIDTLTHQQQLDLQRIFDVLHFPSGRAVIDETLTDALKDHPRELRRMLKDDGRIFPVLIVYDMNSPRIDEYPWERYGMNEVTGKERRTIAVNRRSGKDTERSSPILKMYVLDYGVGS